MARATRKLGPEALYGRWQERAARIRLELNYLFATRRNYRSVMRMVERNERLRDEGGDAIRWLTGIWGRDAVIGVRRELDSDRNTIALGTLLDEMAERPDVLTRSRYMAFVPPERDDAFRDFIDHSFTALGIVAHAEDRSLDHIEGASVNADRKALDADAAPVLTYANRLIAHRTPMEEELRVTLPQLDAAMDAIERAFTKYYAILHGSSLSGLEPAFIGNWTRPFRFAWDPRGEVE